MAKQILWPTAAGILVMAVLALRRSRKAPCDGKLMLPERRRTQRMALASPVFVYGWAAEAPFSEYADTINVSKSGGLLVLAAPVTPAQEVILTNPQTNEDVTCRVARSLRTHCGQTLAGVAFLGDAPDFWRLDLTPERRELAGSVVPGREADREGLGVPLDRGSAS